MADREFPIDHIPKLVNVGLVPVRHKRLNDSGCGGSGISSRLIGEVDKAFPAVIDIDGDIRLHGNLHI